MALSNDAKNLAHTNCPRAKGVNTIYAKLLVSVTV